ncbi:Signal transduction histidine kinase [Chitinophaga sp. CF118]|uniref:response regulator n=1 Tax=Chitinophaga sp. CF118 TaxID=1884367 RepID=UPI0008E5C714|nr:response regulator [Chitinophaga sp. CF118]SFD56330.1 Signal transduction histidine kinase [Chitinophaga sp. CF118]
MKTTFKRNLLIGFGLSLLLLVVSSVASFFSIKNLLESGLQVDHTNKVISELENTISLMKDSETGQRGYLLTDDEQYLEPYKGAFDSALASLNRIEVLTIDNPAQQTSVRQLRVIINLRQTILQRSIDARREGQAIRFENLQSGRLMMDSARKLVREMEDREKRLLAIRTASLQKISGYTPILIVIAALLALLITSVFYIRVNRDFEERNKLQNALAEKDREITRRINIIRSLAEKISAGDYSIRVNGGESDDLGNLSLSLNRMAESLNNSFNLLSEKEWLQTGIAGLNNRMVGEKSLETLAVHIIEFLAEYTHSQVGALYLNERNTTLKLTGSFAFAYADNRLEIPLGQGLAGQCAVSGKTILLKDIAPENITISYATGEIKPVTIIAVPVIYEGHVKGVIELASLKDYTPAHLSFLESVTHNVGIAINTSENRRRVQELLEETQVQSEELQVQHGELENINTELEAQASRLQASEEELRVQQEELQQANRELEERSRLLEDRNQVIVERNLEIQKKADELEISTKYKSEFLANMSHELRTPLNSILLLSRLLSENNEKNLVPDQIESAQVIRSSGKGLLDLIDEILDLSKIESGKMELEFTNVPVHEICADMEALFGPIAHEKNLDLKVNIQPDAPALIETDKMRLEQILKNLLSNALKFTAKGSVTLKVGAFEQNGQSCIRFSVKDTGIGIAADKQQVVFEAFQQADGSTRRKYGGTGLGLSISRELAKLLRGEIRLESEPAHGSEFIVIVPVHPHAEKSTLAPVVTPQQDENIWQLARQAKNDNLRFTAKEIPEEIPDDRDAITENDKVILIVEDDTSYASILLNFTRKRGYKGIVAVRGDHGVEMALQYKPAAILLDIVLPVRNGWQVMDALKANATTRHIPVHIISSLEARKESLQKGAVDFINKPLALEQMPLVFQRLEDALTRNPKKVLIVEENAKHAQALAYFLENFNVNTEITENISSSVTALKKEDVNCVILDMGVPDEQAFETLETVKKNPGLENLPIIIFTGKNLSRSEENRIRQYADSIVIKTAHSYQRMLDEVALFLHLVEEKGGQKPPRKQQGPLKEVLQNKIVLIADDDVRNIFSLTKALEQHKMTIISALDGKEAMQQLENNAKVDIVLMDMMMPEMDGYESIKQIRQLPTYRNLPILAVTAKTMLGDREKCIKAGASDYISKPVDIDQLVSLLRVWLYDNARN